MKTYTQDGSSRLDYSINWTAFLNGATIIDSNWNSTLTIEDDTFTDATTQAFVSGGALGVSYDVKNIINTSDGRVDARTFLVKIEKTPL